MPSEPNNNMEELLKRYAEQRKAKLPGDFELHPATRQMLLGEAARTFGKAAGAKRNSLLFLLCPRLAIIGAFSALLIVTVMTLNRPATRAKQRARNTTEEQTPLAKSRIEKAKALDGVSVSERKESPGLPEAAQPVAESEIAGYGNASDRFQETKPSAASRQFTPAEEKSGFVVTDGIATGTLSNENFALANAVNRGEENEIAAPPPAANAPEGATLNFSSTTQKTRRFAQQDLRAKYRRNLLSPAQPELLQSFELIQNGNHIRLLDGDGSVYAGEIIPAAQDKADAKDIQPNAAGNSQFAFRVIGTNQQNNSVVTFVGEFSPTNSLASSKQKIPQQEPGALRLKTAEETKSATSAGLIEGTVSIDGTNEFPIRAVEVAP